MKSLLNETKESRDRYLKEQQPDWVECRKCHSPLLDYQKIIGFGEKMGIVYHYKVICRKCGTRYHVERNGYVFEKVKEFGWIKSKAYKIKFPELKY